MDRLLEKNNEIDNLIPNLERIAESCYRINIVFENISNNVLRNTKALSPYWDYLKPILQFLLLVNVHFAFHEKGHAIAKFSHSINDSIFEKTKYMERTEENDKIFINIIASLLVLVQALCNLNEKFASENESLINQNFNGNHQMQPTTIINLYAKTLNKAVRELCQEKIKI